MKLPSLEGTVITIKSDQKEAKKCYENSFKTKRGVHSASKGRRGHPCRDRPGETTRTCRRCVRKRDQREDVQAWQILTPRDT